MSLNADDVKARREIGVRNSYAITLDTEFENGVCRSIISASAGVIAVTYEDDSTDTVPIQAGFNPIWIKKISTTGTTVAEADMRAGY